MGIEYKALTLPIQAISERSVTGLAAVFGNIDDGNDMILPGAFTKTLNERGKRIKHLWQHNTNEPPIARITELKEVGRADLPGEVQQEYPDATGGLLVTREYLPTPRGEEILAGIKSGSISEMSFGYDVPKGKSQIQARAGKQVRLLHEVRLWETSDVLFGMNPATRAAKNIKSLGEYLTEFAEAFRLLQAGQQVSADDLAAVERVINLLQAVQPTTESGISAEPGMDEMPMMEQASVPLTVNHTGLLARLAVLEAELE